MTKPEIEIRNNEDGSLDEIVIMVNGECVFHLEQMADNNWWIGCYSGDDTVHVFLGAKGKITASVNDERGGGVG